MQTFTHILFSSDYHIQAIRVHQLKLVLSAVRNKRRQKSRDTIPLRISPGFYNFIFFPLLVIIYCILIMSEFLGFRTWYVSSCHLLHPLCVLLLHVKVVILNIQLRFSRDDSAILFLFWRKNCPFYESHKMNSLLCFFA